MRPPRALAAEPDSPLALLESELRSFALFLEGQVGSFEAGSRDRRLARGVGLASLEGWFEAQRDGARALLTRAVAAGELSGRLGVETMLDGLLGPLYHRFVMGHAPLTSAFAGVVFRIVITGVKSAAAPGSGDPVARGRTEAHRGSPNGHSQVESLRRIAKSRSGNPG